MASEEQYDSEPLPPNCEPIEVHVAELQQLFNAIDPAPFRESQRALASRQRLRQLLRVGRTSLLIGLVFLTVTVAVGGALERALADQRQGAVLRDSLSVGGWVAMWRRLEIFLYDWRPIRAEARLFDRLSAMPVRIAQRSREAATQLQ